MKVRIFMATVVAMMLGLVAVSTMAFAAPPDNTAWAPFANADWVNGVGNAGFGLVTSSQQTPGGNVTYGGIRLKTSDVPTDPNSISALSFDFKTNQTGGSGGSPRMVVQFSDGGDAELRPLTWTDNSWAHLDGMVGNNWDNNGGSGGCVYGTSRSQILVYHPG